MSLERINFPDKLSLNSEPLSAEFPFFLSKASFCIPRLLSPGSFYYYLSVANKNARPEAAAAQRKRESVFVFPFPLFLELLGPNSASSFSSFHPHFSSPQRKDKRGGKEKWDKTGNLEREEVTQGYPCRVCMSLFGTVCELELKISIVV